MGSEMCIRHRINTPPCPTRTCGESSAAPAATATAQAAATRTCAELRRGPGRDGETLVGKKRRKQPPAPRGKSVNQENWCGHWNSQVIPADLWYKAELRRLGIWPPPPERMVFEPGGWRYEAAPGI